MTDHAYGSYTFTVSDADAVRFQVVADPTDGSRGRLKLKEGASLDFEADTTATGDTMSVTVTATPKDPDSPFGATTQAVVITIVNDTTDDADAPPGPTNVPGLKDNEANDDDTDDSDDDDDDDGGTPAADAMAAFASMLDDGLF